MAEAMDEIFARQPKLGRGLHHHRQPLGTFVLHVVGGAFGGDDLGAFDQSIAEPVIAVLMGVDEGADFRRRRTRETIEHGAGMLRVEQGVDQQCVTAIGDETRIGKPPPAIGLKIGKTSVAEIADAWRFISQPRQSAIDRQYLAGDVGTFIRQQK